jgi:hypothetical protein
MSFAISHGILRIFYTKLVNLYCAQLLTGGRDAHLMGFRELGALVPVKEAYQESVCIVITGILLELSSVASDAGGM